MHHHSLPEGVIEGHPLLSSLDRAAKKYEFYRDIVELRKRVVHFAYPRTAWIKISDPFFLSDSQSNKRISSALFSVIQENLQPHGWIRNIVMDFEDVSITQRYASIKESLVQFTPENSELILLGTDQYLESLSRSAKILLFNERSGVLKRLRNRAKDKACRVLFPSILDYESLEASLRKYATAEILIHSDSLLLDFAILRKADFQAISLISPVVHSIALTYGILVSAERVNPKAYYLLNKYGILRPMRSFFVNADQPFVKDVGSLKDGVPMLSFTDAETLTIQDQCLIGFNNLITSKTSWFANVGNLTHATRDQTINHVARLFMDLRQIVKELVENVSMHSQGLGFFMLELNSGDKRGLNIYVGDTGIGLAKGISKQYKIALKSDSKAVEMFMNFKEYRTKRKNRTGILDTGGRGLERVGTILERFSGKVTIRSGTSMAVFMPAESRKPTEQMGRLFPVQGTHIHISIPSKLNAENESVLSD